MKKILLGLGTLSLAILPVVAVVSCGGTTEETKKTDLEITSKPVEQPIIDQAIIDYKAASTDATKQLTALSTVFDKITAENIKNFSVKTTETTETTLGTIILTANKGFAFGTAATLSSKVVMVDLKMTNKFVTQPVIDKAITDYNSSSSNADITTALSTVFDGIIEENIKNFSVKTTETAGTTAGKIVLMANPGFAFGTSSTLSSKMVILDLNITNKFVIQKVIDKAITDYKAASTDAGGATALQTIFEGITTESLKNFSVKTTETAGTTAGTIILIAKPGFAFGTVSSLSSKVIVDLKITNKATVSQAIIEKAITDFLEANEDATKQLTALSTVFDGITTQNLKNFGVKASPPQASVVGTIVLTAKEGFIFGESSTLASQVTTTSPTTK